MKLRSNTSSAHLLILLGLLFVSTLKAQTKVVSDSMQCFTPGETRKIAVTILKYEEDKRILQLTNKQLSYQTEIATDLSAQVILLKKVDAQKEQIITEKTAENDTLKKDLKKERRRHKLTKFGWAATGVVMGTVIFLLSVK